MATQSAQTEDEQDRRAAAFLGGVERVFLGLKANNTEVEATALTLLAMQIRRLNCDSCRMRLLQQFVAGLQADLADMPPAGYDCQLNGRKPS
jgi:hypothetical protein